jgi:hypothetical protein
MAKSYSKELADISRAAGSTFGRQREVLDSAGRILADAARLAGQYGRREVAPRARNEYESHIAPLIASGLVAGRRFLAKTPVAPKKSGLGTFIAAGLGVALVAGVAFVAWQALRNDDGAWVDDEFDVD